MRGGALTKGRELCLAAQCTPVPRRRKAPRPSFSSSANKKTWVAFSLSGAAASYSHCQESADRSSGRDKRKREDEKECMGMAAGRGRTRSIPRSSAFREWRRKEGGKEERRENCGGTAIFESALGRSLSRSNWGEHLPLALRLCSLG